MIADVSINGVTKRLHIVDIHARANNSSDPQLRYDLRKYDVEVLKDSLDAQYNDVNLILLGDYNDDLDFTVANIPSTISSYEVYTNDTDNYSAISLILSNEGFRSFVFSENMIDHITTSNELDGNFIDGSARVGYEFYDNDYSRSASDHLPVSARFEFMAEITNNECVAGKVVTFNQGKRKNGWPVANYKSNPDKALGLPLENFFLNFVSLGFGGEITLKLNNIIADLPGNDIKVFETTAGNLNIPCFIYPEKAEIYASQNGVDFVSLGTACLDGEFDLATGEMAFAEYIRVVDISNKNLFTAWADGYDLDGILCINENSQARSGGLHEEENLSLNEDIPFVLNAFPNPFKGDLKLQLSLSNEGNVSIQLFNRVGQLVYAKDQFLHSGNHDLEIDLNAVPSGIYILMVENDIHALNQTMKIVKE